MEPRYLNLWTKWTLFSLGKMRSPGRILVPFKTSVLACFREAGKNMASDLDLEVLDPMCIVRPKRAKWAFNSMVAVVILVWFESRMSFIYIPRLRSCNGR
jgi:hypothetical protein